jgi:hypothetical protein
LYFTHCTVRVATPPPQVAEQSPHGDRISQRKGDWHGSMPHCSTSDDMLVRHRERATGAPVRPLTQLAVRYRLPPPQLVSHAENAEYAQEYVSHGPMSHVLRALQQVQRL